MLKFTPKFLCFLLLSAAITLGSCEKVGPEFDPSTLEFSVDSKEPILTANSATFQLSVAENLELYYQCNPTATPNDEFKSMKGSSTPLTIKFENLTANTPYTANFYTMDDAGNKGEMIVKTFTTLEIGTPVVTLTLDQSSTIAKTVFSIELSGEATKLMYGLYPMDEDAANVVWMEYAELAGEGTYTMEFLSSELILGTTYTFECYAENETKMSERVKMDFTVDDMAILNVDPNAMSVSFDLDIDPAQLYGIAYNVYELSRYTETSLVDDLGRNWAMIATENGTYLNSEQFNLSEKSEYVLAVVALVSEEGSDTFQTTGEVEVINFSTTGYELGVSDVTIPFDITNTGELSITADLTNKDLQSKRFFFGAVRSDAITTTLEEYLTSINWFDDEFPSHISEYDYDTGEVFPIESIIDEELTGLQPGTDYTVFSVGADLMYDLGPLTTQEITTVAVPFNKDLTISVDPTTTAVTALLAITMPSNVENSYYKLVGNDAQSADEAFSQLYRTITNDWYTSSVINGDTTLVVTHLAPETNYKLYTISTSTIDDVKSIGEMQVFEFNTSEIIYGSQSKAILTVTSIEEAPYGAAYGDRVHFSITLEEPIVGTYAIHINPDFLAEGDEPTIDNYIKAAITHGRIGKSYYKVPRDGVIAYSEMGYTKDKSVVILLPLTEEGIFGTPTMWEYK